MYPVMQYEIAQMRVAEFQQEADRERLIRQAAHDRERGVRWSAIGARLRVLLFGGTTRPAERLAKAGA